MEIWLVFPDNLSAYQASVGIGLNLRLPLMGSSALDGTPHPTSQWTTVWAIPIQFAAGASTFAGHWAIRMPTDPKAMLNITIGTQAPYDPTWFPPSLPMAH